MIKEIGNCKNVDERISQCFYFEPTPLTHDVTHSKLQRDVQYEMALFFRQTNTLKGEETTEPSETCEFVMS